MASKTRNINVGLIIIAVLIALFWSLVIWIMNFDLLPTETTILHRYVNPDGTLEAVLLTKDSGATTQTAYHVAIVRKSKAPKEANTVWVADDIDSPEEVQITWEGNVLVVSFPKQARIFKELSQLDIRGTTIPIKYQANEHIIESDANLKTIQQ